MRLESLIESAVIYQTTGGALKLKVLKLFDFRFPKRSMTNSSIETKLKLKSVKLVKLFSVLFNTKQVEQLISS